MVGSGCPLGPNGPNTAAHTRTLAMTADAKIMSFQMAPGTNGIPSLCVISAYSCRYVERRTSRPGIGHSLMPSFSTISRCSETKRDQQPGNDEDMHREEPRQRIAGDDGSA